MQSVQADALVPVRKRAKCLLIGFSLLRCSRIERHYADTHACLPEEWRKTKEEKKRKLWLFILYRITF